MDEQIIKKLAEEVFEIAKKKSASHATYALAKPIESETALSSKTIERFYNRYISETKKKGKHDETTLSILCKYIGYQDYADYVAENTSKELIVKDEGKKEKETYHKAEPPVEKARENTIHTEEKRAKLKKKLQFIGITGFFIICLGLVAYINTDNGNVNKIKSQICITWNGDAYEEISCSQKPYSKYGTSIEPYDHNRLENFKRIKVDITTPFFADKTHKPLIWYYKTKNGAIEYYSSPGLHHRRKNIESYY